MDDALGMSEKKLFPPKERTPEEEAEFEEKLRMLSAPKDSYSFE